MNCKVDGCDREARYKALCLCQMHYFRLRRNGTTEPVRSAAPKVVTPNGYAKVYVGTHALATNNGYLFEHRKVVFDRYGFDLPDCEICGAKLDWDGCHIDHVDDNRLNNAPENLRPLCPGCNTGRTAKPRHTAERNHKIEIDGVVKTAAEWARHPGVYVSGSTIARRLAAGMSPSEALFSLKRTHKGQT